MEKKLVLLSLILSVQVAMAHEFKSADVCSEKTKDICAHIGYDKKPVKNEKFQFTFDVVNKAKAKDVKNVVITAFTKNAKGEKEEYKTSWKIRPDGHHWDAEMLQSPKGQISGVTLKYDFNAVSEEITIELK